MRNRVGGWKDGLDGRRTEIEEDLVLVATLRLPLFPAPPHCTDWRMEHRTLIDHEHLECHDRESPHE